jgi:hypothetical protein
LINAATDLFDADRAEAWRYPTVWEPVVDRLLQACQALQSGEPSEWVIEVENGQVVMSRIGANFTGYLYTTPQPVVDVFDSRISPAILSFAKGEDELLVRRIWDKVRVAMLSAGKGGE